VRAGLRLMPEMGASKVMNRVTSSPAKQPVKRAKARILLTVKTVAIITNAMANSPSQAAKRPN